MKLLRNILSHGLLIVFFIALALSYVYRGQLFPEKITKKIDYYVEQSLVLVGISQKEKKSVETKSAVVEENPVPENIDVSKSDIADTVSHADESTNENNDANTTDVNTMDASRADNDTEQQLVDNQTMPIPHTMSQDSVANTNTSSVEQNSDADSPTEADQAAVATSDVVDDQAMPIPHTMSQDLAENTNTSSVEQNSNDDGPAETDQAAAATSHADLLNNARLAYQNGKPDTAIQLYKELSELNPDDPNVYGEMGNVFYSQGKWKQAGLAYYEAANCLLEQGNPEQVAYLYRVIQGLDQESAGKLRAKLGR